MFITFEGIEGSGKTTQICHISEWFTLLEVRHIITREPGGTFLGNQIRSILLGVENRNIDPSVELLLCQADRIQHIKDVIRPNISTGVVVISDRYVDSTIAYQGFGRGLSISRIRAFHDIFCFGLMPDLTFIMDLDPSIGLLRARRRDELMDDKENSRFEEEEINFHKKIRKGYLELAKVEHERFHLLDASLDENQVKKQIKMVIKEKLLRFGL